MGILGKVNPTILENIEIDQDIFYAEMDLDLFTANMKGLREYKPISAFPSVEIDLAIVIDEKIKNKFHINSIRVTANLKSWNLGILFTFFLKDINFWLIQDVEIFKPDNQFECFYFSQFQATKFTVKMQI